MSQIQPIQGPASGPLLRMVATGSLPHPPAQNWTARGQDLERTSRRRAIEALIQTKPLLGVSSTVEGLGAGSGSV